MTEPRSFSEHVLVPLALTVIIGLGGWNAWTTVQILQGNVKTNDSISSIQQSVATVPQLAAHLRRNDVKLHNHAVEICRLQHTHVGQEQCGDIYYLPADAASPSSAP